MKRLFVFLLFVVLIFGMVPQIQANETVRYFKEKALVAMEAKDWNNAILDLQLWAESASDYSEIVNQATVPLHKVTDATMLSQDLLTTLAKFKDTSDKYRKEAHLAMVLMAECYFHTYKYDEMQKILVEVFQSLSPEETEVWNKALDMFGYSLGI